MVLPAAHIAGTGSTSVIMILAPPVASNGEKIAIYGPIIIVAPYVMLSMRATPLRGQVRGGWAQEIEGFLGPVIWR
jgi:hypothetical protein